MDAQGQESLEALRFRLDSKKDIVLTTQDKKRVITEVDIASRSVVIKEAIGPVMLPDGSGFIPEWHDEKDKEGKVILDASGEPKKVEVQVPCAHWVPLSTVTEPVLKKVLEWCTHHRNDPPASQEEDGDNRKKSTDIEEWDQKFMQVDQEMLFEIILAANYMDIKPLLDVGCKTVANMIKGKSPEEIRKTFNIQNDFTPEEEDQIRRENEWAEDR